ncbi:MAG TPA: recombinase family protein [Chloroflexota bacterium]
MIYLRVSTGLQEKHGYGLDTQERECRALADREGITVTEIIRDVDSGTEYDLPGVHRLLDLAERGEVGTAIIYDPDRLSRSLSKYVWLDSQLTTAGVQAHYVTVGAARNEDEKLFHDMKAVFAQWDHRRIVRRMASGKRDKAAAGLIVGTGEAPYGYRYLVNDKGKQCRLAIDEERAAIVRRIFRDAVRWSLRAICDRLNAEGIPTAHAHRAPVRGGTRKAGWYPATLLGILDHPVYLGRAPYGRRAGKGKVPVTDQGQWIFSEAPAIITQAEWDAAHAALDRRRILRQRPARSPEADAAYPLRGLLACAHCGGALHCDVSNNSRYYWCLRHKSHHARRSGAERCPLPAVPARALEALAWGDVVATLLDPERLAEGFAAARAEHATAHGRRAGQLQALTSRIAALRARLSRILDEQLDAPAGSESARLLREKAQQIEASLSTLQAEHAQLAAEPTPGLSDSQIHELTAFAAEVCQGVEHAMPAERRRIFQLLQLKGAVRRDDAHGRKFALKHRFSVAWEAIIRLRNDGREFVNVQTIVLNETGSSPAQAPKAAE